MNANYANVGSIHIRLLTLLCYWICCGLYFLVVYIFGFPLCLFYSLCPLWLWYFENQQVNPFTDITQYVQHKV
jgi:hypothetical protein